MPAARIHRRRVWRWFSNAGVEIPRTSPSVRVPVSVWLLTNAITVTARSLPLHAESSTSPFRFTFVGQTHPGDGDRWCVSSCPTNSEER
eukprot:106991-Rhodomonas_salina.1